MMTEPLHQSVLLSEVVLALAPRSGGVYIDATLGLGGHAEAILDASAPAGRLLGVDRDPAALDHARRRLARFGDRVTLIESDFLHLAEVARSVDHAPADGLVADLGVSSLQLDEPARGFSFQADGPLDMRMGPSVGATAKERLALVDLDELTRWLAEYGEVERPKSLARAILDARDRGELSTTRDLARVVVDQVRVKKPGAIHPATRVFQALRIAVNRELEALEALLRALPQLLKAGGRAAIISFHSLEDRLVKNAFRDPPVDARLASLPVDRAHGPLEAVSKKPITPSSEEIARNPRARSAKLRVAQRRAE